MKKEAIVPNKRRPMVEKRIKMITEKREKGEAIPKNMLRFYYNNKYPYQKISYLSRSMPGIRKRMPTDVRDFITPRNYLVADILTKLKVRDSKKQMSSDDKAKIIQKWVIDNISYLSDADVQGYMEFWQFPFETISMKSGDCEDGAILMTSLLIGAGIEPWRVRIAGGLVKTHNATAPTGGHGWCCYLRESDNKWIPLDWCYYPEFENDISERKTLKEAEEYIETWFSWNNNFTWGRQTFDLKDRITKD
jgi:transglutaminase-like putative cysteine protease